MSQLDSNPVTRKIRIGQSLCATKWQFYWLCGLILSFAYERPIVYLTPFDRTNPRLFDVIFLVGILFVFPSLRRQTGVPKPFRIFAAIVSVFCFCAAVWFFLLPFQYGRYSLFFAAKYVEGLIVIYIAIRISLNSRQKRIIHYLVIVGGIFVALYCIPEYLSGSTTISIGDDQEINIDEGTIRGPLGIGYYHLAMFSGVSCLYALALVATFRGTLRKICVFAIACFIAWPAFFSGSRTGPLFLGVMVPALMLFSIENRRWIIPLSVLTALAVGVLFPNVVDSVLEKSITFKRIATFEEKYDNSFAERLNKFKDFKMDRYIWKGIPVPFIGAGFYVAPTFDSGVPRYRIGYGFHNAYLFALEQGGLGAFILFFVYLGSIWRYLSRARRVLTNDELQFANATMAVFIGLLFVGLSGLGFWYGIATEHFAFYTLLLYLIAGKSA